MAGDDDLPAILAMRRDCFSYLPPHVYLAKKEPNDSLSANSYLGVIELNGEVIGSGRVDNKPEGGHVITRIVTDGRYRGKGVGKAIVNHLINHTSHETSRVFTLRCLIVNVTFYKKFGFKEDGNEYSENGIIYQDMIKE